VAAVAHQEFVKLGIKDIRVKLVDGGAFIDVKAVFNAGEIQLAGYKLWRL
jgi:UDP-N-acetyl-D-galactosamine dehydrogenase